MLGTRDIKEYLDFAKLISIKGGEVLKSYWGKLSDLHIREKKFPGDLVTEADKLSEEKIIEIIKKDCPSHAILSEEAGFLSSEKDEFLWVIDPLDGTTNYTHQFPFVAVSIALLYRRIPIVGVVYNPILEELFCAAKTFGAFLNEKKICVSETSELSNSLLVTGFPYDRRENLDNNFQEFIQLTNLTQGVRRIGAASLDLAYVASGKLDGFWEKGLKPWDMAAGALLVEEARGKVSSYDNTPLDLMASKILASNGKLHEAISKELLGVLSRS